MGAREAEATVAQHVVCRIDEVPVGGSKRIQVAGRDIALFNTNGTLAAIANTCPHAGASLCKGRISGLPQADEPGEYRFEREGELVRCPWHGWEFDIRTGKSYCDPARTRVKSYEVSVEKGAALEEGPYRIEVYEVSLQDEYVVLSL